GGILQATAPAPRRGRGNPPSRRGWAARWSRLPTFASALSVGSRLCNARAVPTGGGASAARRKSCTKGRMERGGFFRENAAGGGGGVRAAAQQVDLDEVDVAVEDFLLLLEVQRAAARAGRLVRQAEDFDAGDDALPLGSRDADFEVGFAALFHRNGDHDGLRRC